MLARPTVAYYAGAWQLWPDIRIVMSMNLLRRILPNRRTSNPKIKSLAEISSVWQFMDKSTNKAGELENLWETAQREVMEEEIGKNSWVGAFMRRGPERGIA